MAGLDDLLVPQDNSIPGADFTFLDADTVRTSDGVDVRLRGVLAPETGRATGEVGGTMTTQQVIELANKMGYTNVVYDENDVDDTGTRFVGDLQDKHGRSFSRALASKGLLGVSDKHDISGLRDSAEYGAFLRTEAGREEDDWDKARNMIEQSVLDEQRYENQFKTQQLIAGDARYSDDFAAQSAAFEYRDRATDTGKSLNPLSDAWDTGLIGVQESWYGIVDLLGEETGYDPLKNIGQAGITRARNKIADRGHFITDYKDVDGFWTAVEYLGNNAALSLPYMGISVAGAVASPFTGGLSLTAPAAIYAGQTWNEMEGEKNAAVALGAGVAQAALDRVGLGFIAGGGKAGKQLLNEGIDRLVSQGMTREAATATVMAATRKELAGFAGDAASVAAQQLTAKKVAKDFVARAGTGALGEGATEALQETTAYVGATLGSDKTFDWNELVERQIQAAIAGSTLGGTFAVPGAVYNTGAWADVAYREAPAEARRLSRQGSYAQQEIDEHGRVSSIQEEVANTKTRIAKSAPLQNLDDRAQAHKSRQKSRSFGETFTDTVLSAPALWRGATRFIFSPELQDQSRSLRILADMFGGNLQRTFSGSNFEASKHHRVAIYKNLVPIPESVYSTLSGGKRVNRTEKAAMSQEIYAQLNAAVDPDTKKFNPDLVTGPNADVVRNLGNQLNALSDKMWNDQKEHNPDLGYIDNYLFRYKSLSKKAVNKNRRQFEKALMDNGYSASEAKALTDEILDNPEVNDVDDAFSVTRGGIVPGAHRKRALNMSEKAEFQDFMEQDVFANVANAAKSAARYTAHRDFIGQNGEVISKLLEEAEAEGVSREAIDKIAAQMKDYLDAESGNYKRPTSEAGKSVMRLQKNFMLITTLAGLPLATISSFVEAALTMRGLTSQQIFGKDGGLSTLARELATSLWQGTGEVADVAMRREGNPLDVSNGQERLRDLGFYEWDVGAATVTGVSETSPLQQDIYQGFFKWTGLTGWTNFTRAVRASMAGDYMMDKIETIRKHRAEGGPKTNAVQEAEEALRNIGVNVDDMVNIMSRHDGAFSPEEEAVLERNMREGTYNYVNDAVALPGSANRPLIYQDPRFALFTQFQGFIATFTANHIPKLWGEYVKRGTPAMKYNAFALMTTMIVLGFASQYLKDLIKHGKMPADLPFGEHPHLEGPEYIQRGIRASGLLGTGERVLDQFFPLYDERTTGTADWLWTTTTGESPALGTLKTGAKSLGKLASGDVGGAARQGIRLVPGAGPFNWLRDAAQGVGDQWNFK